MKNPYKVLGISPGVTDIEIKETYIRMVKTYPPDRHPEKFKEIRKAYETIATPRDRVTYTLFSLEDKLDPHHVEHLVMNLVQIKDRKRISPKKLIETIVKKISGVEHSLR